MVKFQMKKRFLHFQKCKIIKVLDPTAEFYNLFWKDIGSFSLRSINYSLGELSVTQKEGVIKCIPKCDKNKQLIKNWRPISSSFI